MTTRQAITTQEAVKVAVAGQCLAPSLAHAGERQRAAQPTKPAQVAGRLPPQPKHKEAWMMQVVYGRQNQVLLGGRQPFAFRTLSRAVGKRHPQELGVKRSQAAGREEEHLLGQVRRASSGSSQPM